MATYEFTALPFGLSTAPYIFTKVPRPVVTYLRNRGYQSVIYLDDLLLLGSSKDEYRSNSRVTVNLLHSLGFVINHAKSHLEPLTRRKFLGFIFYSINQTIVIPPRSREKLLSLTSDMARRSSCPIRVFACLIGSLVSVRPAVQYGLLYTKAFERAKCLSLAEKNEDYSEFKKKKKNFFRTSGGFQVD